VKEAMDEELIKSITLEGLNESFGEIRVNNGLFDGNQLSQSLEDSQYRIDVVYDFTKSSIDGKEGVSLIYKAKGDNGHEFQEATTLFTGHLEYDIKGAIDEMAKLDVPLIHHYFTQGEMDKEKLTCLEAVYYNPFQEQEVIQGWKAYVGVQKCVEDGKVHFHSRSEEHELFYVLHGAINQVLYPNPQPYLIKCWITRIQVEGMWADCRVNMQDWEIGRDLLYDYAEGWVMKGQKRSIKQVLLLVPVPMEDLENGEKILSQIKSHFQKQIAQVQKKSKKKFWEFWK